MRRASLVSGMASRRAFEHFLKSSLQHQDAVADPDAGNFAFPRGRVALISADAENASASGTVSVTRSGLSLRPMYQTL
jgi:hypothetical protein